LEIFDQLIKFQGFFWLLHMSARKRSEDAHEFEMVGLPPALGGSVSFMKELWFWF
jgi:hypothetical protein